MTAERVAAIDCGTNSIRLLVADVKDGRLHDLVREMVITRLGQGVDRTGRLSPEAIARTVAAAEVYAGQIEAAGVERVRFVTTSASRDAENRDEFLDPIRALMGLEPQVLTGEEEARLSFLGAISALDQRTALEPPYLVVDIGGGSTEFVLGTDRVEQACSADMGSVRVTERFGGEPWTTEKQAEATEWIDRKLDWVQERVDLAQARTIVGCAGTVTSMGAFIAGVTEYDPVATHGLAPSRAEWDRAIRAMVGLSAEDKHALPFMPPGRGDVIGGGALIWQQILQRIPDIPAVVSEHDILDGLALSLAAN